MFEEYAFENIGIKMVILFRPQIIKTPTWLPFFCSSVSARSQNLLSPPGLVASIQKS